MTPSRRQRLLKMLQKFVAEEQELQKVGDLEKAEKMCRAIVGTCKEIEKEFQV